MTNKKLDKILAEIVSKYQADMGTIHLIRTEKPANFLYLAAHIGLPDKLVDPIKKIPLEKESIAPLTFLSKKPVVIGNLEIDSSKYIVPMERTLGIGGMISVPIFLGNEVIGVLGIGCLRERKFIEKEAESLIQKGKQIADMI